MRDFLEESVSVLLFIACVFFFLFASYGCSPKLADISLNAQKSQSCPRLAMPPVPEDVVLDIKGDKITANAGGEVMLRGYVRARELLR